MSERAARELPALIQLFRPRQQVKNGLVFVAPVLAGIDWDARAVGLVGGAFAALVLATAATYTFNDLRDRHIDVAHPTKAARPIARGAIRPRVAVLFSVVAALGSIAVATYVNDSTLLVVIAYLMLTTSYSMGMKHVPVVELVIVSLGFVLRILAGATAVSVGVTDWFLIVIGSGALMVITSKRESEDRRVREEGGTARGVLAGYSPGFFAAVRGAATAVVITTGFIATFSRAHEASVSLPLQASVIPFAIVILEFNRLSFRYGAESPEHVAYSSRVIQLSGLAWVLLVIWGVYG